MNFNASIYANRLDYRAKNFIFVIEVFVNDTPGRYGQSTNLNFEVRNLRDNNPIINKTIPILSNESKIYL